MDPWQPQQRNVHPMHHHTMSTPLPSTPSFHGESSGFQNETPCVSLNQSGLPVVAEQDLYTDPDAVLAERERQRVLQNRRMSAVDQAMRAEIWQSKSGSILVLRPRI